MSSSPQQSEPERAKERILKIVKHVDSDIKISSFKLEDGTVLKVTPIVVGIQRVEDEVDDDGNPQYIATFEFRLDKDCSAYVP
jgi:hypothetical protein